MFHEGYIGSVRYVQMSPPGGGGGGGAAPNPASFAAAQPAEPIPAGFNWEMFQGPAPRKPFLTARRGWRGWWDYGGGNLTDWGVHLVDVMAWLMKLDNQAPLLTSASAQPLNKLRDPERTPGSYAVTWQYENFIATLGNVSIPGVEHPEEVDLVHGMLTEAERSLGLPVGGIRVAYLIESGWAAAQLPAIAMRAADRGNTAALRDLAAKLEEWKGQRSRLVEPGKERQMSCFLSAQSMPMKAANGTGFCMANPPVR